ncbi:MAG: AAA family ATPase [bacterium]
MPVWEVRLCGEMRLQCGDRVITRFRTKATDAVFAYLALHLGSNVRREKLIETVWPEADEGSGRQSLRTALTSLRSLLGNETLEADRNFVRLVAKHFQVDVHSFRATKNLDLCQGKLLEGLNVDWVVPFATDLEEEQSQAVLQAMSRLPEVEARALGEQALRRDPSRLEIRAKLRETGQAPNRGTAPYAVTSFVGRERELDQLNQLFQFRRLVTLTGLGGSGKTRIAAEFWRRKQPNAWFIPLADLHSANDLAEAVRRSLRLSTSNLPATDHIVSVLETETGFVILDNFEHLISGADLVNELLTRCPLIHILVTSQLVLGLPGECEYSIGPLSTETEGGHSESVSLFEDRARAVLPTFAVTGDNLTEVDDICRRLDGFPLALEIAAAKSRLYSPGEMLLQLKDRFTFLSREEPSPRGRQSSLRAAIDWGFDRLSKANQTLLTELSVFRGGFTLDAAQKVCRLDAGDGIESLLVHSWIERVPTQTVTRFRLLESIREYGAELLPPSQLERLGQAHADYYRRIARACGDSAFKPEEPLRHLAADADIHNIHAASAWLKDRDPEANLDLVEGLNWYYLLRGMSHFGEAKFREVLSQVDQTPRRNLAWATHAIGNFVLFQRRHAESEPWFMASRDLAEKTGDSLLTGLAICQLAQARAELGYQEDALALMELSLAHLVTSEDDNWIGAAHTLVALIRNRQGESVRAIEAGEKAVDFCRRGGYPWGLASSLNELAMGHFLAGDYAASTRYQAESMAIKREARTPRSLALSLIDQAATYLAMGELGRAKTSLREGTEILVSLGEPNSFPQLYGTAGEIFFATDEFGLAATALAHMSKLTEDRAPAFRDQQVIQNLCVQLETVTVNCSRTLDELIAAIRAL